MHFFRSKISPTAFALSKVRQTPYDKKNSPTHATAVDKARESKALGGSADVYGSLSGTIFSSQSSNTQEQFSIRETLQLFEDKMQDVQKQHRIESEVARKEKNRPSPPRILTSIKEAVTSSLFFKRRTSLPAAETVAVAGTVNRREDPDGLVQKRVQQFQFHHSFDG